MNFTLSEEQKMIQQATREFAQKELLPGVIERDENQSFPKDQIKKMSEMGLMGMMFSKIWRRRNGYNILYISYGRNI